MPLKPFFWTAHFYVSEFNHFIRGQLQFLFVFNPIASRERETKLAGKEEEQHERAVKTLIAFLKLMFSKDFNEICLVAG